MFTSRGVCFKINPFVKAIDLWGVGEDNETIHIIELKCGNNLKVGVISKTLFYTAMIYDVCVNPDGWFSFGHYKKTAESNDMKALYNNGIKFKNLFVAHCKMNLQ